MLSPKQFEQKKLQDIAKVEQIAQENADIISQHDALFLKIQNALTQVENDLDTLQGIENDMLDLGKKTYQVIHSRVAFHSVSDNIPTLKAAVTSAKDRIIQSR